MLSESAGLSGGIDLLDAVLLHDVLLLLLLLHTYQTLTRLLLRFLLLGSSCVVVLIVDELIRLSLRWLLLLLLKILAEASIQVLVVKVLPKILSKAKVQFVLFLDLLSSVYLHIFVLGRLLLVLLIEVDAAHTNFISEVVESLSL